MAILTFHIEVLLLQILFIGHIYGIGILINEINSNDPSKPAKKEFIELIGYKIDQATTTNITRLKSYSLQGYKLIVISAYAADAKTATIELVANLWNSKINENGYFVLGGIAMENADMNISSGFVTYRKKFGTGSDTLYNFFANANKYLHAVALIWDQSGVPAIVLSSKVPYLKITAEIAELLKTKMVDMVVYGRRAPAEHCDIFEELHVDFVDKNYMLREYDVHEYADSDFSLNRCTMQTEAFLPEFFKLGTVTPGAENDCSGRRVILEAHIEHAMQITPIHDTADNVDVEMADTLETCSSRIDEGDYQRIVGPKFHRIIQTQIDMAKMNEMCNILNIEGNKDDLTETGSQEVEIQTVDITAKRMSQEEPQREWDTTKYFHNWWLDKIKEHQKSLFPISTIEKHKNWFEYLYNSDSPQESKYRCRLCSKYFDQFKMESRYRPALANVDGILRNSYRDNQETIAEHSKSKQHASIISTLQKQASELIPKQFEAIQKKQEQERDGFYAVTMRMIRSVYTEIKTNIPFLCHPQIVRLQEINGVFLGYHHYERTSANRMTLFISDEMHLSLVKHLTSKQRPLSIIIDSSTDSMQRHYLIIYIQALENEGTVLYFYKLLMLEADETATGMMNLLENEWRNEGHNFYQYMKKNLVGFASDGASVMMGKHNGLKAKLTEWVTGPLYGVHCMAHRLHLAIRRAMKDITYMKQFEDLINHVHNFYNHHGHKRKAHLRELARVLNVDMYEVSYIYEVRWIASEYTALKKVNDTWYLLITDLEAISIDMSFNDATRSEAKGLAKNLKNKYFILILQFMCDLLKMLAHWSKSLQQRAGVLPGLERRKNDMLNTFIEMKNNDGIFLTLFLRQVVCSEQPSPTRKCSLNDYYKSVSVRWHGIELEHSQSRIPKLDDIRDEFLVKISDEIDSYFPDGQLSDFQIFVPSNFPQSEPLLLFYGIDNIQSLASTFNFNHEKITREWTDLLLSIVKSDSYCRFQKSETIPFWQHYLNDNNINWGENIVHLIRIVLVLPIGSADAERGFSIMNHILTSRRTRLTIKHLDAIMRLRINGPDEIEKFNAEKYAKSWVINHMRSDDPQQQRKKHKQDTDLDNEDNEDLVYLPKSTLF